MRVNLSVGPFLINRPVKILCTNLARSCLYEQSWWQRNQPSPKCSLKVGSIARRRSVICHSREHFHWWRAWHHCIRHFLWCSVMSGLDATAQPWKPLHSLCSLELMWRLREVWGSVAIDSAAIWQPLCTILLMIHSPHSVILRGLHWVVI